MFESVRGGYGGTTAAAVPRGCRGWGRWALLSLRKRVHLPWNPKVNQHVHGLISFTHPLNKIVHGLRPGKSHSNDSYRINGKINDLFSSYILAFAHKALLPLTHSNLDVNYGHATLFPRIEKKFTSAVHQFFYVVWHAIKASRVVHRRRLRCEIYPGERVVLFPCF